MNKSKILYFNVLRLVIGLLVFSFLLVTSAYSYIVVDRDFGYLGGILICLIFFLHNVLFEARIKIEGDKVIIKKLFGIRSFSPEEITIYMRDGHALIVISSAEFLFKNSYFGFYNKQNLDDVNRLRAMKKEIDPGSKWSA